MALNIALFWLAFMPITLASIGTSGSSTLSFDLLKDGHEEMTLSNSGLTIRGDLHLDRAMTYGLQEVAAGTNTVEKSMVLANTQYGDVHLALPPASQSKGKVIEIKNISGQYAVKVDAFDGIGEGDRLTLPPSQGIAAYGKLVSDGKVWHVWEASPLVIDPTISSNLVLHYDFNDKAGVHVEDRSMRRCRSIKT